MAIHLDREHYIPVRVSDLLDFLCDGKGCQDDPRPLAAKEESDFRRFGLTIIQFYHLHFVTQLQRMKDAYAPFDPDAETVTLTEVSEDQREKDIVQLCADTRALVERFEKILLMASPRPLKKMISSSVTR